MLTHEENKEVDYCAAAAIFSHLSKSSVDPCVSRVGGRGRGVAYYTRAPHYSRAPAPTLVEHPHPLPLPMKPRNPPISSSSLCPFKYPQKDGTRPQGQLKLHVCKKIAPEKTQLYNHFPAFSTDGLLRHRGTPNGCPYQGWKRGEGELGGTLYRAPSSVGELLLPSPAVILDGQNSCDGSPAP